MKTRPQFPLAALLVVLATLALLTTLPASATVFAPTTDRQLADRAEAVVIGTVLNATPHLRPDGYVETEYHVVVEDTLKGNARGVVTIVELGGVVGDRITFIADSASYAPGERVMAFLRQRQNGTYFTASMALGRFAVRDGIAVRESSETGREAHNARDFAQFVRAVTAGAAPAAPARVLVPESFPKTTNGSAKNYALTASGLPVRWPGCEVSCSVPFKVSTATSLSFPTAASIAAGRAAWTNDPASNITLTDGGTSGSTAPAAYVNGPGDENVIYLNFGGSFSGPGYNCDGALACTIGTGGFTHTFDGDTWVSIGDADVIISGAASSGQFPALITHELGHCIGIRHSDQGTPSCPSAIMNSSVPVSFGTTLQQWDKDAVDSLYGSGPVCVAPTISGTSGGGSVNAGQSALLSVTVNGACQTFTYQWYSGISGNISTPAPGASTSSSYTTPPITTPSNFWVRVSNACGHDDSQTITVTPIACVPPNITSQPASQSISSGTAAALQVGHGGSPSFTYQWYTGASGDTSHPVSGANQRTFTTPNLTQTTSYWVLIQNSCGSANSDAAVITVLGGPCQNPVITRQPVVVAINSFSPVNYLIAGATGVTSYNWFQGNVGDTSHPIPSATPSNARFVAQLYADLLGRTTDAGAAVFVTALDLHASTRQITAQAILNSTEYRTGLLNGWYQLYLHRNPSAAEISFWLPAFAALFTDEQIESQILGSPEYLALSGGTNTTWINRIFGDVLGRTPNAAEVSTFNTLLTSGSRMAVALNILNSLEARTLRAGTWFTRYLRRTASGPELSTYAAGLATFTDEQILATIFAADEYFNFPSIAIIGPGTSAGGAYWVQAVNTCGNTSSNSVSVISGGVCPPLQLFISGDGSSVNVGETPPLFTSFLNNVPGLGIPTYQWYRGTAGDTSNPIPGATTGVLTNGPANTAGTAKYWVQVGTLCGNFNSNTVTVNVICAAPKPVVSVQAAASVNTSYVVSASANSAVTNNYEYQESLTRDFANPTTTLINSQTLPVAAKHFTTDTRVYYRGRTFAACNSQPGPYSEIASILIIAIAPPTTQPNSLNPVLSKCVDGTDCSLNIPFFISGFPANGKTSLATGKTPLASNDTYSVTADKPFITVTPASGPLPPEGVTVNVHITDADFQEGSTEASLVITKTQNASGKIGPTGTTSSGVPVSINLVSPSTPKPKDTNPPINTLLIPAVAHAEGIGAHFQSDVRITNTSSQSISYQLTYTPTAIDGTTDGKTSTLNIAGGDTKALNDVVEAWYGAGAAGEGGVGTLEIRPMSTSAKIGDVNINLATVASSRTYNLTSNGTYGQFIPAMPLASFLAKSDVSRLSLQQVAQSSSFRTNVGLVEGAGQPADMVLTLYSATGAQVAQRVFSLKPFEHQQQSLAGLFPGTTLADGRLEVKVTSDGGKVTAYASVLDNATSDPFLVFPVDPSKAATTRVVVPGIAELNNGAANFHSDMRIFNGGTTDANVTLSYTNATVPAVQVTVKAGEVVSYDNTLKTLWNLDGTGGAVIAATDTATPIVVTARTYSRRDDGGTYGQFIPGVTANDAAGNGDRPLQVVQLEQSPAFRSNLGLAEVTGNPVTIDIAGFSPDSKVAAHVQRTLGANEFVQLGNIFSQLGFSGNTYNGRIAVTAIGGTGRVAAYGSVVDNRTQDPTYVPAQ